MKFFHSLTKSYSLYNRDGRECFHGVKNGFAAVLGADRSASVVPAVSLSLGVEDARPVSRLVLLPGVHLEEGLEDATFRAYLLYAGRIFGLRSVR